MNAFHVPACAGPAISSASLVYLLMSEGRERDEGGSRRREKQNVCP